MLGILQCVLFIAMSICYFMQAKDHKDKNQKAMMSIDIFVGVFALIVVGLYIICFII